MFSGGGKKPERSEETYKSTRRTCEAADAPLCHPLTEEYNEMSLLSSKRSIEVRSINIWELTSPQPNFTLMKNSTAFNSRSVLGD